MKTALPALFANGAANSLRERLDSAGGEEKAPLKNFNEHLHLLETKRGQQKATPQSKEPIASTVKSVRQPKVGRGVTPPALARVKRSAAERVTLGEPAIADEPRPPPDQFAAISPNPILGTADGATLFMTETPHSAALIVPMGSTETISAATTEATMDSARRIVATSEQPSQSALEPGFSEKQTSRERGDNKPASATEDSNHSPGFVQSKSAEFGAQIPTEVLEDVEPHDSRIVSATQEQEAPAADGTTVAKQSLPMNNTVEMDKVAESAVKNLPGAERTLELPAARAVSRVEETRQARLELHCDATAAHAAFTAIAGGNLVRAEDATPMAAIPAVERVVRTVLDGVAEVRHAGRESVSVVLKPDAGTEFLLRVEMRDGAVSAQLHFERGDRSALDPHWDELHRRLAEQGVSLSRDDGFDGGAQFAQSERRSFVPQQDADPIFFRAGGTKKNSGAATITRRSARGFETWA